MYCLPFDLDPRDLAGKRVLIFEDEFSLAEILSQTLTQCGATVLGPVSDPKSAMSLVANAQIDAAVIDVDLGLAALLPVVTALRARKLQLAFVSGHDNWFLPEEEFDLPAQKEMVDVERNLGLLSAGDA